MRFSARKGVRTLITVLVFVLVFFGMRAYQQRGLVRVQAPELAGTAFMGERVDLAHISEPTLVYFWAGWCPVCTLQSPVIQKLAQDYPVVTVAMQTEAADIQKFLAGASGNLPVLPDPDGRIAQRFGIRGVPAMFIVVPGGEIRFTEVGYTTGPGLRLRLWWAGRTAAEHPASSHQGGVDAGISASRIVRRAGGSALRFVAQRIDKRTEFRTGVDRQYP